MSTSQIQEQEVEEISAFLTPSQLQEYLKGIPALEYIWGPITVGSLGFVVGPSKTGKTTMCENLACNIAAGRSEFLGYPIKEPGSKVALALLEESIRLRGQRHFKIIQSYGPEEQKNIEENLLILGDYPSYLTNKKLWDKFSSDVEKAQPDILILDSLTHITTGKISEGDVALNAMARLKKLTNSLNITTVVIHHTTKLYKKTFPEMDNIKGSTEVVQECDYAIGLGHMEEKLCFKTIVSRYSLIDTKFKEIELDENQRFKLVGQASIYEMRRQNDGRFDNTNLKKVENAIIELSKKNPDDLITTKSIIESVDVDGRRVYELLTKLINQKIIERVSKGKYRLIATE